MSTAAVIGRDVAGGLARNPVVGVALVVGIVAAVVWWKWGDKLKAVVNKFNPASDENLVYSGINAAGAALSGNEDFSLGAKIYDWNPFTDSSAGEDVYYTVTFPGGARHAVASQSVGGDGVFTYQGTRYRLGVDATGAKVARTV